MQRRSAAEVKRDFGHVLRDAEQGEHIVVMRHGKPVAVVGPFSEEPQRALPTPRKPGGLLALVGLFEDWETMDEDITQIIAARQDTFDRPPIDLTS